MVNWARRKFLNTQRYFRAKFVKPIEKGQHLDAEKHEEMYMRKRCHVLNKKLSTIIHRRDFSELEKELAPKTVFVLYIKMTKFQKFMYKKFFSLRNESRDCESSNGADKGGRSGKNSDLFAAYQNLLPLWNHPGSMVLKTLKHEAKAINDENNVKAAKSALSAIAGAATTSAAVIHSASQSITAALLKKPLKTPSKKLPAAKAGITATSNTAELQNELKKLQQ